MTARGPLGLAGDRLVIHVLGVGAETCARALRERWSGTVVVGGPLPTAA